MSWDFCSKTALGVAGWLKISKRLWVWVWVWIGGVRVQVFCLRQATWSDFLLIFVTCYTHNIFHVINCSFRSFLIH